MSRGDRARLVALEGIDGAGKSTLGRRLSAAWRRRGYAVRLRREPADPRIGRLAQEAGARDAWTGAVYFTVDRHLARSSLERDLDRHDVVLTDRSLYSTLAYQGSLLTRSERRRLLALERAATVLPDTVVLLDLPVERALPRVGKRNALGRMARGPLERRRTLARVARAYRTLARRGRWVVLDARHSPTRLLEEALLRIDLPSPRRRRKGNRYPRTGSR